MDFLENPKILGKLIAMQPDPGENSTIAVQNCLRELAAGSRTARDRLIELASHRLRRLTQTMFRDHSSLARWEEADDVYQRAVLRLWQALRAYQPQSVVHFYRFAAQVFRRELIDIARHYFGPLGDAANHATRGGGISSRRDCRDLPAPSTWNSANLQPWTEFHQAVEQLPDDYRVVFDLLWYQGLSQADAAHQLGISERTLQRRWQEARVEVYRRIHS